LPFSTGCIHLQERNRTSAADCGTAKVAWAGPAASAGAGSGAATACGSGASGGEPLLKLYANGFLQRAKGALLFRSHQRQGASR